MQALFLTQILRRAQQAHGTKDPATLLLSIAKKPDLERTKQGANLKSASQSAQAHSNAIQQDLTHFQENLDLLFKNAKQKSWIGAKHRQVLNSNSANFLQRLLKTKQLDKALYAIEKGLGQFITKSEDQEKVFTKLQELSSRRRSGKLNPQLNNKIANLTYLLIQKGFSIPEELKPCKNRHPESDLVKNPVAQTITKVLGETETNQPKDSSPDAQHHQKTFAARQEFEPNTAQLQLGT